MSWRHYIIFVLLEFCVWKRRTLSVQGSHVCLLDFINDFLSVDEIETDCGLVEDFLLLKHHHKNSKTSESYFPCEIRYISHLYLSTKDFCSLSHNIYRREFSRRQSDLLFIYFKNLSLPILLYLLSLCFYQHLEKLLKAFRVCWSFPVAPHWSCRVTWKQETGMSVLSLSRYDDTVSESDWHLLPSSTMILSSPSLTHFSWPHLTPVHTTTTPSFSTTSREAESWHCCIDAHVTDFYRFLAFDPSFVRRSWHR